MRPAFLACLALLACSEPPRCVTACGVVISGEAVDCAEFQRMESELSSRMPIAGACGEWRNLSAVMLPGRTSMQEGRLLEGWADCDERAIWVHAGWAWPWRTAFMHELAHVAQRCAPLMPVDNGQDEEHADWSRTGITTAILDAKRVFMLEDARR